MSFANSTSINNALNDSNCEIKSKLKEDLSIESTIIAL